MRTTQLGSRSSVSGVAWRSFDELGESPACLQSALGSCGNGALLWPPDAAGAARRRRNAVRSCLDQRCRCAALRAGGSSADAETLEGAAGRVSGRLRSGAEAYQREAAGHFPCSGFRGAGARMAGQGGRAKHRVLGFSSGTSFLQAMAAGQVDGVAIGEPQITLIQHADAATRSFCTARTW
jgi:hypothetical protein